MGIYRDITVILKYIPAIVATLAHGLTPMSILLRTQYISSLRVWVIMIICQVDGKIFGSKSSVQESVLTKSMIIGIKLSLSWSKIYPTKQNRCSILYLRQSPPVQK